MSRIRRVMFASDFSPASGRAFAKAIEIAKLAGARLVVTHTIAPFMPLMSENSFISPETWNEIEGGARAAAQKSLKALVLRAQRAGLVATSLLTEGTAAQQIVESAKAKRADLLVIGTHGRSGFSRLLLGSVAGHVVATAPCPVLTVRGK
jgi:nucleotide-binding universal stress UspA family protein